MSRSDFEGLRQFDNLIFDVHNLDSALFHLKDIEQFESEHPELFSKAPSTRSPERIADLEAQLAQARQENECLTQEIERLKAEGVNEPADCAACKAESSHIDEWVRDVEIAVTLTNEWLAEGEKKKTHTHKLDWQAARGSVRKRAFEAFRRSLPDHLKAPE